MRLGKWRDRLERREIENGTFKIEVILSESVRVGTERCRKSHAIV